jgi:hypothetical protein
MFTEVLSHLAVHMGIKGAALVAFWGARGDLRGSSFREARCCTLQNSRSTK